MDSTEGQNIYIYIYVCVCVCACAREGHADVTDKPNYLRTGLDFRTHRGWKQQKAVTH